MTDGRKLIEMDDEKSHSAETEGRNIMSKGGGARKSQTIFVSMTTQAYPRRIVRGSANGGSKSCIFGIPQGQVLIGSASLEGWGEGQS